MPQGDFYMQKALMRLIERKLRFGEQGHYLRGFIPPEEGLTNPPLGNLFD